MVQEYRKILDTLWKRKQKRLSHVLRHSAMLHDILEERMLWEKARRSRQIQTVDDLTKNNIYTNMKKAAEDSNLWLKLRRDCHSQN